MIASASARAPQQYKYVNNAMSIDSTPAPILLSHLREEIGGQRRGILIDIGCMGIAGAAIL
jgi:hypothetical protein